MSGISYDLKKIRAVVLDIDGVLSPSVIPMDEEGRPVRMMNVKDGYALLVAVKKNLRIAIISGGADDRSRKRFEALGIRDIYCNVPVKLPVLLEWMNKEGLTAEEVAYMGDDIPDLQCMRAVRLPAAPYDASNEARAEALFISKFGGGYGCVRDLLQQILAAKGEWMAREEDFHW